MEKGISTEEARQYLLNHYSHKDPAPFIQYDVFTENFDDFIKPDDNGISVCSCFTYELMTGPYSFRVLIRPDTPREKVIAGLESIITWIKRDKPQEGFPEAKTMAEYFCPLLEQFRNEKKVEEMNLKLKDLGYSDTEIKLLHPLDFPL